MMKKVILSASLALAFFAQATFAADYSVHGFLQANYSPNVNEPNPDNGAFKWAEERAQLKLDGSAGPISAFMKADAFFDRMEADADVEVREAHISFAREKWDLRVGRQIITWGLGDLVFVNDVFPKDYEAFFSGRPIEYLKKGVDGLKAGIYPGATSIELVVIPFFEPNNFPATDKFWLFDPMPGVTNRVEDEPDSTGRNTEAALRIYRDVLGFDASVYAYRGFYREPSFAPDSLSLPTKITLDYPELAVYGLSLQRNMLGGVTGIEAGYYDSLDDRSGRDPLVPNSEARFLVSHQRQVMEDLTATVQYYGEYTLDYDEYEKTRIAGLPKGPEFSDLVSLRLTYLIMRQNMRLQWFSFWSTTERDFLLNPEVKYNFSDHVWAAVGANIFGGACDTTRFGSMEENDNVYIQARYEF
jgi:hypothetical protein